MFSRKIILIMVCIITCLTISGYIYQPKPLESGQYNLFPMPSMDLLFKRKKEVYPKDSAFYGLAYRKSYGQPINVLYKNKLPQQNLEDWRVYFPELTVSLNKLNQQKQNKNFTLNTFSNSRVVIVDERTEFKTGDVLKARIDAYDWKENKASFGGDYFIARLVYGNVSTYPDGIAGIITDHQNGTYSIEVPLLIPGEARLEVELMIPLEGIAEYVRCTSLRKFIGVQYLADFETKERTECNVDFSFANFTDDELCDYSNPRNQEPWFCIKPPSGKCSKITNVFYRGGNSVLDLGKEKCDEGFINTLGCSKTIQGSGIHVTVKLSKQLPKLSACNTMSNGMGLPNPNGYFLNGAWKSRLCDNNLKSIDRARPCFENKDIYILGDSTSRQYYYWLAARLQLKSYGKSNQYVWQEPQTFGTKTFRFYYRGHGPPLQNPGPQDSRPYVTDMLDEITPGSQEVVVILNIGLHITYFEPSFFIHRMRGIKDAMLRLNQRRPNVRYVYRSHRVLLEDSGGIMGWLVYRYRVITREIFKGVKNFFYFDAWDMSSVWPLNDVHPSEKYLDQEALYFTNFICNGIKT
ncbi:NXPE family member 2-like [Ciona intestinalis]